ncbi:Tad domain-containing protein [Stakelama sp. CBK3Z-3]|uniref:Tad domain-containing protein n=2 Tax=Stakelama flava TaxID=2860338 RepID=A0ABS6XGI3_9SPHN|nr:Tad domain-containing protein [Stakelama flava]
MQNKAGRRQRGKSRGFLSALAGDVRGNTLAIVAAALIPLTAMIGSGLDMSVAYMAQDRLQQACDSGVLAARKLLSGPTLTDDVNDEARKYFNFNFPQNTFQTTDFDPKVTVPEAGTVHMTASTTVPTSIMKIFGYKRIPIEADCSATQDFVSTDVMMVVDMSGSMNCPPSIANSACNEVEQSGSKMQALRNAASSLYDTLKSAQDQLHGNNLRLRYGFVPYNGTVNVGKLVYAKNSSYIRKSAPYQTRQRQSKTVAKVVVSTSLTQSQCNAVSGSYQLKFSFKYGIYGECTYSTSVTSYDWEYGQFTLDTSQYITGQATPIPSQDTGTATWGGCIEMRKTNNTTIDGGSATIAPSDAYDLDINLIPYSDDTRWAPWWPEVEINPNTKTQAMESRYCASQASRLKEYYNDKTSFMKYLNGLKPQGGTYHDIGMIWGARFISPDGIFKSDTPETNDQYDPDNPKKIRGFQVRKYLIFMTDGDMAPTMDQYSSYGIETYDRRVLGSSASNQEARHLQRFRMACNAAKSENIQVWVIAFATTLTTDMKNCASTPDQAAGINSSADLIAKFEEIGSKIGALRLNQ